MDAVDLLRASRLRAAASVASTWRGISMRLPMKPWQTPATTATFLIFLASCIAVTQHVGRGLGAAHDLEQLHDIGRREEVQADHVLRPRRAGGDLVDVEIGGVGGEDRARLGDLVELAEHLLLDVHILEHRLDDQVAIGERVEVERRLQQAHRLLDLVGASCGPWPRSPRNSCASRRCRGRAPPASISTIVTGIPADRKFIEMPPPIVPAPITPTRLMSRGLRVLGQAVDLGGLALGEEEILLGAAPGCRSSAP